MLSASFDPCSQGVTCHCTNPMLGKGDRLSSTFSHILFCVLRALGTWKNSFPERPPLEVLHIGGSVGIVQQSVVMALQRLHCPQIQNSYM